MRLTIDPSFSTKFGLQLAHTVTQSFNDFPVYNAENMREKKLKNDPKEFFLLIIEIRKKNHVQISYMKSLFGETNIHRTLLHLMENRKYEQMLSSSTTVRPTAATTTVVTGLLTVINSQNQIEASQK